ncbi:hypothetical protein [Dongshaea marina]|uniref:hypothetical protein n=1 Tax=Dongshaea marina TaxID=2047966 RepID=UPI000D3EB04C|nr:hypothetical protein [Dongshaea marina]
MRQRARLSWLAVLSCVLLLTVFKAFAISGVNASEQSWLKEHQREIKVGVIGPAWSLPQQSQAQTPLCITI